MDIFTHPLTPPLNPPLTPPPAGLLPTRVCLVCRRFYWSTTCSVSLRAGYTVLLVMCPNILLLGYLFVLTLLLCFSKGSVPSRKQGHWVALVHCILDGRRFFCEVNGSEQGHFKYNSFTGNNSSSLLPHHNSSSPHLICLFFVFALRSIT
jgi:hypothetical protein